MKSIEGYDYIAWAPVKLSRAQWQDKIARAIKAGGWRRVEDGETFCHTKDAKIIFEVYANIAAPKCAE